MKIWIVNEAEPIPQLNGKGRNMRAGVIADIFTEDADSDVTWWFSTFLHYEKKYYASEPVNTDLKPNLHLKMLHVKHAYRKNISLARMRYCAALAGKLKKAIRKEEKPDVILCAWPNIESAYECVRYGKENGVPVVIDIRDFWPDIFVQPFNGILKRAAKAAVNVIYGKKTRYVMQNADKVIGVIPRAIGLAEKYGRTISTRDHPVFLSYKRNVILEKELAEATEFWEERRVTPNYFIAVYVGSLTDTFLYSVVIEAAKKNRNGKVKFVICGGGPNLSRCAEETEGCSNIIFPGYMNLPQMHALCGIAKVGLLPYKNKSDFIDSVPSKFSEYLSYGLPILTTLKGLSKAMVESENCGSYFSTADELNGLIEKYANEETFRMEQKRNSLRLFEKRFNAVDVYSGLLDEIKAEFSGGV